MLVGSHKKTGLKKSEVKKTRQVTQVLLFKEEFGSTQFEDKELSLANIILNDIPDLPKVRSHLREALLKELHFSFGLHPLVESNLTYQEIYTFIDSALNSIIQKVPSNKNPLSKNFEDAISIISKAKAFRKAVPKTASRQLELAKFISPDSKNFFLLPLAEMALIEKKLQNALSSRLAEGQKRWSKRGFLGPILRTLHLEVQKSFPKAEIKKQALVLNLANSKVIAKLGAYEPGTATRRDFDKYCRKPKKLTLRLKKKK